MKDIFQCSRYKNIKRQSKEVVAKVDICFNFNPPVKELLTVYAL